MKEIKVVKWTSINKTENTEHRKYKMSLESGGVIFKAGMPWDKYMSQFDEYEKPYIEAIRESAIELNIKITGEAHQYNEKGTPLFSDDTFAFLSFRGWGNLMAAIWSTQENKNYDYMDFYM